MKAVSFRVHFVYLTRLVLPGSFLEYMRNYSHPNMDIAYYTERSIEDEIARESESDTTTVLISYLIMFAYISIALGQYNGSSRLLVSALRLASRLKDRVTWGDSGVEAGCSLGRRGDRGN